MRRSDNHNHSGSHGHRRRARRGASHLLGWAMTAALGLLFATQASAGTSTGVIEWLDFPTLEVVSDGYQYTDVSAIGYAWEARIVIDAAGAALIKSWQVYPGLEFAPPAGALGFQLYKASASYGALQWKSKVDKVVGMTFPDVMVEEYATGICNWKLDNLMDQGYSRATVLGQDRTATGELRGHLSFDVTVGHEIVEFFVKDVDIVCKKSPFKPVDPGSGDIHSGGKFEIQTADLLVFPSNYSGACPKDLTLFMEVQSTLEGTFEARVESTAGWKSTKFVLATNEFDPNTGLWKREFNHPLAVPIAMPPGGGAGGGVGGASNDLQSPTRPDDPVFPGGQGGKGGGIPQGPGGLAAQDPGPNVHQQSLRLVARANGKTVVSDWDQFRVTCDPRPALDPVTTTLLPGLGGGPKPPDGDGKPTDEPKPNEPAPERPSGKTTPSTQDEPSGSEPSKGRLPKKPKRDKKKPDRDTKTGQDGGKLPSPGAGKPVEPSGSGSQPGSGGGEPTSKPTSNPTSKPGTRPAAGQADLRVVQARRSARDSALVEFEVENRGAASAARSQARLVCEAAAGGSDVWTESLPGIPAGGRRWVASRPDRSRKARNRVQGCDIVVDSSGVIAESNERNNSFSCRECGPQVKRRGR